ncbi:hypothetical protein AB4144_67170, partial [Rhizobiaceae sp. 2RAB30]
MDKQTTIKRPTASNETRLTPEQTLEVFEHLKFSTSLELKLMVPDTALRGTINRIGFDMIEA